MNGTRRVFISYSWSDKPLARRVTRRLRQNGVDVFLDETHLGPGMALPESLRKEIHDSSHLLVLWTATAITAHFRYISKNGRLRSRMSADRSAGGEKR